MGFIADRQFYGTLRVIGWLLESVPEDAVTVIVYVPAGVPFTGVWVVLWLQAGTNKRNAKIMHSMVTPTIFRRRRSLPIPRKASPGIASQNA